MKKPAEKSIALLFCFVLAASAPLSALAYDAGTQDITGFYASVDSYTHTLRWLNLDLDSRFISFDEQAFSFSLKDSSGSLVADETMGVLDVTAPDGDGGTGFELYFTFETKSLPVLNPDEYYTLSVPAGVFSTGGGEQNAELVVGFLASEFISERSGFLGFLDYIYNTPVLRIVFAPLIAVIEFIYCISVYLAMR